MKKAFGLILLVASFFIVIAAVSSHEPKLRKGIVIAEPLSCHQEAEKLVCFDGRPSGNLVCNEIDDNTVLCSPKR